MPETREQKATRLADLVLERTRANGFCSDDDLYRAGFTTDDIHELAPLIRDGVAAELNSFFREAA